MEDTYLTVKLAISRDGDGPEFACVANTLNDTNGLFVDTVDNNPLLDTRSYEVKYQVWNKASLAVNIITINVFAQVEKRVTDMSYSTI